MKQITCRLRNYLKGFTVLLFFMLGCANLGHITYYDSTTYKSLTDLKPEVLSVYDNYASENIDEIKVAQTKLKIAQLFEYEKGKGEKNINTVNQINEIQGIFDRSLEDRRKNGKWNETYLKDRKENISDAFDLAIQTENLKNRR
ncbi:MAG: hypothetical protein NT145_04825 [Elusimicrobia bacterium]|nr:hypothetical protein [Elusimicrobiota bacterium]